MTKPIVLITFHVLVEASPLASVDAVERVAPLAQHIEHAITAALPTLPTELGVVATEFHEITADGVNSGQCTVCGVWVTDPEQPEPVRGLQNGARVHGQLLCDDDLPADHPWAF
jgi:hypothetical protein